MDLMLSHWHRSGVFIVNFEHVSHLVLVFLLLTLNMQLTAGQTPSHRKIGIYMIYERNTNTVHQHK